MCWAVLWMLLVSPLIKVDRWPVPTWTANSEISLVRWVAFPPLLNILQANYVIKWHKERRNRFNASWLFLEILPLIHLGWPFQVLPLFHQVPHLKNYENFFSLKKKKKEKGCSVFTFVHRCITLILQEVNRIKKGFCSFLCFGFVHLLWFVCVCEPFLCVFGRMSYFLRRESL